MESIKRRAIALGFDDFVCVSAAQLHKTRDILDKRRDFGWELEIEQRDHLKRVEPRMHFPSVETVMVGFVQIPIAQNLKIEPGWGNLSSISWGLDYHQVLGDLFKKLIEVLQIEYPGEKFVYQVDTGPLCERSFASRTGVGRIGRHGNFIHRTLGSYVAIGLLLTSLKLKSVDRQLKDICGDCNRCVNICPGGAISESGEVNPQKCVSWLTQKKSALTTQEARVMGSSLYGCDLCQLVCPQNKNIIQKCTNRWGSFTKRVELRKLSELSNREFKRSYGQLSGAWRGKKVWVRNAEIILKNQSISMI